LGQLGQGELVSSPYPSEVQGLQSGVTMIDAGHEHACAVVEGGAVKCWGTNYGGQLGLDLPVPYPDYNHPSPQDVVGLGAGAVAVSCAQHHSCALMDDRTVRCWGLDLPQSVIFDDYDGPIALVAVEVPELGSDNAAVVTGTKHTCVLKTSRRVECLGRNHRGQLGDGTYEDSATPVEVVDLDLPVRGLVGGGMFNCALLQGGGVKCWGNGPGLGVGPDYYNPDSSPVPLPAHGLGMGVAELACSGHGHVCVELESGSVWCWGAASSGQCGNGTIYNSYEWWPWKVEGL
jgi:alpha-tubulin suppressor-like RCC1 family protein